MSPIGWLLIGTVVLIVLALLFYPNDTDTWSSNP